MSAPVKRNITRVRSGCWTCKARRKKCDEERPHCQTCRKLGIACEGYGLRLRWAGLGRPRVSFNHRNQTRDRRLATTARPVTSSESGASSAGSHRHATLLQHLGRKRFDELSELEKEVLYDCIVLCVASNSQPLMSPQMLTGVLQRSLRIRRLSPRTDSNVSPSVWTPSQCY
jgi:hypothetical protein